MSYRRRVQFASVRLRESIARGASANPGGRQRRPGLYAPGRTRHWARGENSRLQITGGRTGHGRSKRQAWVPQRSARLRARRTNTFRPRSASVPFPDQQPEEGGRTGGLRFGNGGAGADTQRSQSAQRQVSRDKKDEAGTSLVIADCGLAIAGCREVKS